MKWKDRGRGLLIVAALAGAGSPVAGQAVPEQVIVQLVPGASIDQFNADYGTSVLRSIESQQLYLLAIPAGADEDIYEEAFEEDPRVAVADLNDEGETPEAVLGGDTQTFFFYVAPGGYDGQC